MFKCEHGTQYYESKDAQKYLGISNHVLRAMHNDGFLRASGYVSVGYLYTKGQLDAGWNEYVRLSRKDVNVEVIHV
jgi:hypothetical protein